MNFCRMSVPLLDPFGTPDKFQTEANLIKTLSKLDHSEIVLAQQNHTPPKKKNTNAKTIIASQYLEQHTQISEQCTVEFLKKLGPKYQLDHKHHLKYNKKYLK